MSKIIHNVVLVVIAFGLYGCAIPIANHQQYTSNDYCYSCYKYSANQAITGYKRVIKKINNSFR